MRRGIAIFGLLLGIAVSSVEPAAGQELIPDPLEPMNRAIFAVNDTLDVYLFEPVARGYDYVLPDRVKLGVKNFFQNLGSPVYIASDLMQLKFTQAGEHTQRFLINTTIGLGGVMDIAKLHGIPHHDEDTGTAFGYWGMGPGFYLVLPLLGPSDARDAVGRVVDGVLTPTYYIDGWEVALGLRLLEGVDERRRLLDAVETGKESSLDYYTFVKSSFSQYRLNLIYDGDPPPEELSGEEQQ